MGDCNVANLKTKRRYEFSISERSKDTRLSSYFLIFITDGGWGMADGGWGMSDGRWRMGEGGWRMGMGDMGWRMEDGEMRNGGNNIILN
uniref:Uncharacterized protein n=1 Tax=Amphimedon queenslandica TaxID=400682 RepID=A0A1X7SJW1_AMPQE